MVTFFATKDKKIRKNNKEQTGNIENFHSVIERVANLIIK